jgi:valyl-tRNA synthetase
LDETLPIEMSSADRWIVSRLQRAERAVEEALTEFRFDVAARAVYEFVWDEYCDWYVELAKAQLAGSQAQQRATRRTLIRVLEATLRLAHPFIPFITEELWQKVAPLAGRTGDSIMVAPYPQAEEAKIDGAAERDIAAVKDLVNAARNLKSTLGVDPKARLPLYVADYPEFMPRHELAIATVAKQSEVHFVPALPQREAPVSVTPSGKVMLHIEIDRAAEKVRLTREIEKVESDLEKQRAKLGNPSFAEKAPPPVVEQARRLLAETEARHADLRGQLGKLG